MLILFVCFEFYAHFSTMFQSYTGSLPSHLIWKVPVLNSHPPEETNNFLTYKVIVMLVRLPSVRGFLVSINQITRQWRQVQYKLHKIMCIASVMHQ